MPYYVHPKTVTNAIEQLEQDAPATGFPSFATKLEARSECPKDHTVTFWADGTDWDTIERFMRTRFASGGYVAPWGGRGPHYYHRAHLHLDDPGMVFYFESEEKAYLNRLTTIKPGRYMERYLAAQYLSEREINAYVMEITADKAELKLATTADDIRTIYNSTKCGFSSCMQRKSGSAEYDWQRFMEQGIADHPAVVYAGPDLAVAYRGELTAVKQRAVVWPEQKTYTRIYGSGPLQALLARAGYRANGIDGARVQKIAHPEGGYLMPYIDGCDRGTVDGPYIVLSDDGNLDCQNTSGSTSDVSAEPEEVDCERCGCSYSPDDMTDDLCPTCYDERWRCDSCRNSFWEDDSCYSDPDGNSLCESCYSDNVSNCEHCNEDYFSDSFTSTERRARANADVSHLCRDCATEAMAAAEREAAEETENAATAEECEVEVEVANDSHV